jgi:hypothetical protein
MLRPQRCVIDGEGDMDVHADRHPTAFVLTALIMVALVTLCVGIALGQTLSTSRG